MPIRARLALSFAAVTLLLVGVSGVLFLRSFRDGLVDSLGPGLRAQSSSLAARVREKGTSTALNTAQVDIVEQVLDASGRVLATTREGGAGPAVRGATVRKAAGTRVFANTEIGGEREPYRVLAAPVATGSGQQIVVVATTIC